MSDKLTPATLSETIAAEVVNDANIAKGRVVDLEQRFLDASKFLDEATDNIKESWLQWMKESKEYLEEVRTWRMAVEREKNTGISACKDLTAFLGSDDIRVKVENLRALVEIAERLKALKDAGFLDALVDTLVKLDK